MIAMMTVTMIVKMVRPTRTTKVIQLILALKRTMSMSLQAIFFSSTTIFSHNRHQRLLASPPTSR